MTRICPVCGNNPVTKPQLGMCNVCFAQEHGGRVGLAQQSAENKKVHETITRRMEMKREVAEGLRQVAARAKNPIERALLMRGAIIAADQDPLLYDEEQDVAVAPSVQHAPVEQQFAPPISPSELGARAGERAAERGFVIVHGGTE